MADQEAFVGQICNKDGVLKMFTRPRGQDDGVWTEIANFSLHLRFHSANKIPNEGRFFIFEGQVSVCPEFYKTYHKNTSLVTNLNQILTLSLKFIQTESCNIFLSYCFLQVDDDDGETFLVPFTLSQLDNNHAAYSVLKEAKKPHGGRFNTEKIGKGTSRGQLHNFLMSCVKRYKNSGPNRKPALVLKNTGFISVDLDGRKIDAYTIGPNQVLTASEEDADALEQIKKVWIGASNAQDFRLPVDYSVSAQEFLNRIQEYHGPNKSSPIAGISYMWLSMHKKLLAANGIKLGLLQVVGEMGVGKSAVRAMWEEICPKKKTPDGNITNVEATISFFKLYHKVLEHRWVFIQDPPTPVTEAKDVEKLNAFADCYYENKVEVTSASKHNIGDAPDCGMIFVWPNEFASLDKVNRTYATKVVTLVHKSNEADFVTLERAWRQEMRKAPAIFLSFLEQPDMQRLVRLTAKVKAHYYDELKKKNYSAEVLNEGQRILEQYALLHAATHLWKESTGYNVNVREVGEWFLETCIPFLMRVIEEKKNTCKNPQIGLSPEKYLSDKLQSMTDKDLLCNLAILQENNEVCFGFSHVFHYDAKGVESFLVSMSTAKGVKAVLHKNSDLMWFKRTNIKGYDGHYYGKSNRLTVYVCPVSKIPDPIKKVVKDKLDIMFPCVKELDFTDNIRAAIDEAFDKLHHPKGSGQRTNKAKLMSTIEKLTEEEAMQMQKHADRLIRKRRHDSGTEEEVAGDNEDSPDLETAESDQNKDDTAKPNQQDEVKSKEGEGSVESSETQAEEKDTSSNDPKPSTSSGDSKPTPDKGGGRTLRSRAQKKGKNN